MTASKKKTRAHEHRFTLEATPAEVWKAITEADELTSWFPMDAQVEPGVGGKINYVWAPEMQNPCKIEIWEPGSHLRTSWMEPVAGDAEGKTVASVVDWFLDGKGGRTTLRLVHSGFGAGSDYDNEYDGTNRGWEYELRSLRHYLKYHSGTPRKMISLRQPVSITPEEVWARLMGDKGLAPAGGATELAEGRPYSFKSLAGEFNGEAIFANPPLDFAGTVENMNNALFRVAYETCFGTPEAFVFISTWGVDAAKRRKVESDLRGLLQGLFT